MFSDDRLTYASVLQVGRLLCEKTLPLVQWALDFSILQR